jgi:hypothetical protein
MVPRPSGQIGIEEVITAGHNIEAGTFLLGNNNRERIAELLAVDGVEHGGIQRAAPQAL